MSGKLILITVCLILASYGIAGANFVLTDQAYMPIVSWWYTLPLLESFDGRGFLAQGFKPSRSSMEEVRLAIHINDNPELRGGLTTLLVKIREDSINGPIIGWGNSAFFHGTTQMARFPLYQTLNGVPTETFGLQVDPGRTYIIDAGLSSEEGGPASIGLSFVGGGYSEGLLFIDGVNYPTDNSDLIFATGNLRSNIVKILSGADALCHGVKSNDKLIIALLSNDVLNATQIDPESVSFAGAGVKNISQCRPEDSNSDGLPDLVCSIDVTRLIIEPGALSVNVRAETYDGMIISGYTDLCYGLN